MTTDPATGGPDGVDPVAVLVGFGRALRAAGVPATPDRVARMTLALDALDALGGFGGLDHSGVTTEPRRSATYWAGRLTTCAGRDDIRRYDAVFDAYFHGRPAAPQALREVVRPALDPLARGPERDPADRPGDDWPDATGGSASELEVLRHADLAALTGAERARARQLLARLRVGGPTRPSRRRRPDRRGAVDQARTVRSVLRQGGEVSRLARHTATRRPRRLVLLVDVSGSMAAYAPWSLLFAHAAVRARRDTEVFTLGTRLTRVTRELRNPDPDAALRAAGRVVPDWSGGTALGTELAAFVRDHGRRGMARGAVVVVASDGWERGDPVRLGEQVAWLSRLAHRVVWLNPHVARPGFAPSTAGLASALPYVDALVAGHSVAAYQELADLLATDLPRRVPTHA